SGKVTEAKRRLKAAKKSARAAKAERRKARKLLRGAKAEARKAEKRARKSERKLSRARKASARSATPPEKTDGQRPKTPARRRRRRSPVQVDTASANSVEVVHSRVAIEPTIQVP